MWAWMHRIGLVLFWSSILMFFVLGLTRPEWAQPIIYAALLIGFFCGLGLALVGQFLDPELRRIQAEQEREFVEDIRGCGQLIGSAFYGTVRRAGAIWRRMRREWRGGT